MITNTFKQGGTLAILLLSFTVSAQVQKENTLAVYAGLNIIYPSSNVASFGSYHAYTLQPDASAFWGHLYANFGVESTNPIANRNLWFRSSIEHCEHIIGLGVQNSDPFFQYYAVNAKFHELHLQSRVLYRKGRVSLGGGPLLAYRFLSDPDKFYIPEEEIFKSFKKIVWYISGVVEIDLKILSIGFEYRRAIGGLSNDFTYDGQLIPFRVSSDQYLLKVSRTIFKY